jgi:hypothetical protein
LRGQPTSGSFGIRFLASALASYSVSYPYDRPFRWPIRTAFRVLCPIQTIIRGGLQHEQ